MTRYLIVPGWAGSGPAHWQSHWARELATVSRVEMLDWFNPKRGDWVSTLDQAIRSAPEAPVLVAHSLGCIAVAHWAQLATGRVRGAFLVAPPDLDRKGRPAHLREFAPVPRAALRFPSRVVASDNDPYGALPKVIELAFAWGSEVTVLEAAGHINVDAGYGAWPDGRALLEALV
jgi:predicted alpha/beta hydrolase family esterase